MNRTTQFLLYLLSGVAFIEGLVAVAWTAYFGWLVTGAGLWHAAWSVAALSAAGAVCLGIVFVLPVGTTTARGWGVGLVGIAGYVAVNAGAAFSVGAGWLGIGRNLPLVLLLAAFAVLGAVGSMRLWPVYLAARGPSQQSRR